MDFFRLIYLNYLVLENEAKLKRAFTFSGVALSCLFAVGHLLEYTVRNDSPEMMFHYHYCAKECQILVVSKLYMQFDEHGTAQIFLYRPS